MKEFVFSSAAFGEMLSDLGVTKDQLVDNVIRVYGDNKKTLSREAAEREIVAQFIGERLLQNEKSLKELARSNCFSQFAVRIRRFIARLTGRLDNNRDLVKLERLLQRAVIAAKKNPAATQSSEVRHSIGEIIGNSGTNYGIGVYLDSTLLSDLSEDERIVMVKERVKELGGSVFTAYDENYEAVDIHLVSANETFKNKSGRKVAVNKDLISFLDKEVKQESVVLMDELVYTSTYRGKEHAHHPHGWVDNNGTNDWDVWTTYVQDKEKNVWEAKLRIANTKNGDKIPYDIFPIEMVEQSGTSDTISTNNRVSQNGSAVNTQSMQKGTNNTQGGKNSIPFGFSLSGKADTVTQKRRTKLNRASVEAQAKALMERAGAKGNRTELFNRLLDFYEYIAAGSELSWETIQDAAVPVVNWLTEHHASANAIDEYA